MLSIYNSKNSIVAVDGVVITSKAEEFWSFTKRESYAEDAVGADGDVVRNESNDPIWDCEITVLATSPQAGYLFDLRKRKTPFPIWNENKQLGRRAGGALALMSEAPEDTQGTEAGELTFTFTSKCI